MLGLWVYVAERTPPAGSGETWALAMRWHDPATVADLPDYDQARRDEQAARAKAEAAQRRIAELEERLRRLRGGP